MSDFDWNDHPIADDSKSFNWGDHPVAPAEEPSALEAGLRGAGQGATLGFEPAIAGVGSAAGKTIQNVLAGNISLDDAIAQYKKTRDSEKQANEASQKAHPMASLAGNLVGGAGLAAVTAGAGLLPEAAEGANLGARMVNAAKVGALAGGTNGLGNSVSSGAGLGDTAKNVAGGAAMGAITGPVVEAGITGLKNAGSGLANEFSDLNSVQKFKKAFGYGLDNVNLTSKAGAKQAQEGVENAAEALGFGARDLNKSAGAEVGAAKDALQESGKTFDINPTLDKIQTAIENLKQSDHPSAQQDATFLQKYLDNLTSKVSTEGSLDANAEVNFKTANDIRQALTDFGGTSGNGPELRTTDALNASKLAAKDLQGQLVSESPGLASANQKASASYRALDALGVDDSHFETNPLTGEKVLTPQGEAKLANTVRQIGRGTDTQAGQNASNKLNTALDYLKGVDPDKAAALEQQVTQAGEIHNLAQQGQGNIFTKSGLLDMGPVQAGNRLGRLASTPVNTLKGVVSGSQNLASSAAKKVSTAIQPLTDTAFGQAAKELVTSGSGIGMKLGSELAKAIGKDNSQKNAILFSLMQQPTYREHLQKYFGSEGSK